jgi:hypothetical protein
METQTAVAAPPKPADKPENKKAMKDYLHETEIADDLGCSVRTVRGLGAPHVVLNREHWYPRREWGEYLRKRTRTPRGR